MRRSSEGARTGERLSSESLAAPRRGVARKRPLSEEPGCAPHDIRTRPDQASNLCNDTYTVRKCHCLRVDDWWVGVPATIGSYDMKPLLLCGGLATLVVDGFAFPMGRG